MCLNPKYACKKFVLDFATGEYKTKLQFIDKNIYDKHKDKYKLYFTIPCGRCYDCKERKSRTWAFRVMNEVSTSSSCCFITLTYAEDPVNLKRRDVQLFLKRLRKKYPDKNIRYFGCGEYGGKRGRPHYHMVLFNYKPVDLQYFFTKKGIDYFLSDELRSIWSLGHILVQDVTIETAKYSTLYLQKLNDVNNIKSVPPFLMMSLKPGIGYQYFVDHMENCLKTDKIYVDGQTMPLPRYYEKKVPPDKLIDYLNLKENRHKIALLKGDDFLDYRIDYLKKKFNVDLNDLL